MFRQYDTDNNGSIDLNEFTDMVVKLGVAPTTTADKQAKKIEEA